MAKWYQEAGAWIRGVLSRGTDFAASQLGASEKDEVQHTSNAMKQQAYAQGRNVPVASVRKMYKTWEREIVRAREALVQIPEQVGAMMRGVYDSFRQGQDVGKMQEIFLHDDGMRACILEFVKKDEGITALALKTMTEQLRAKDAAAAQALLNKLFIDNVDQGSSRFMKTVLNAGADVHADGDKALVIAAETKVEPLDKFEILNAREASFKRAVATTALLYGGEPDRQKAIVDKLALVYQEIARDMGKGIQTRLLKPLGTFAGVFDGVSAPVANDAAAGVAKLPVPGSADEGSGIIVNASQLVDPSQLATEAEGPKVGPPPAPPGMTPPANKNP